MALNNQSLYVIKVWDAFVPIFQIFIFIQSFSPTSITMILGVFTTFLSNTQHRIHTLKAETTLCVQCHSHGQGSIISFFLHCDADSVLRSYQFMPDLKCMVCFFYFRCNPAHSSVLTLTDVWIRSPKDCAKWPCRMKRNCCRWKEQDNIKRLHK